MMISQTTLDSHYNRGWSLVGAAAAKAFRMRSSRKDAPPPQAGSQSHRSASWTQRAGDLTSRARRDFSRSLSGALDRSFLAVTALQHGLLSADR